jgi:broad specificity phosphatase PhoE
MSTRLLLIRHAGTLLSSDDRYAGSTDVELSDEGRSQSRKLAVRLAKTRVAAVYCSHLKRAVDTARAVATPHGLTPILNPALREVDHGHWEGLTRQEIEARFGEEFSRWREDPFGVAPAEGESGRSVLARALPAVREILAAHENETVAIVSHKATNRLLIANFLGIDMRRYRDRIAQDLACLNVLLFDRESGPQLNLLNDTSHYLNMLV